MSESHEPGTLKGRKLVQVALTTRDMERSKRYYRDVLGLPLLFEAGGMMFFDLQGTRLLIGNRKPRTFAGRFGSVFRRARYRSACTGARGKGCRIPGSCAGGPAHRHA